MPLENTARSFLVQQLGVQSPSLFSGASKLIASYLRKEAAIIAGLERLRPLPVDQDSLHELEKRARAALTGWRQESPGSAAARDSLQRARDELKAVKAELAKLEEGGKQFCERVQLIQERLDGAARKFSRRPRVVDEARTRTESAVAEAVGLAKKGLPAQAWGSLYKASKVIDGLPAAVREFDSAIARLRKLLVDVADLNDGLPVSTASGAGRQVDLLEQQIVAILQGAHGIRELQAGLHEATAQFEKIQRGMKLMAPAASPENVKQQLVAILERPDGTAELDWLAENVLESHGLLTQVLQVRFNLPGGVSYTGAASGSVQELRALHEVMRWVPAGHVSSRSLQAVTLGPGGINYIPADRRIQLSTGLLDARHELGNPREVPGVPDELKPPAGSVPTFHYSTLHEVGHAVDDSKRVMSEHAGELKFGGWTGYGANVEPIALQVASAFNIEGVDAVVIVSYIATGAEPFGEEDERWTEWTKVQTWADGVRHGNAPWKKGELCQTDVTEGGFKLGDHVYYEGYPGLWFGHLASQRKKGISGYQFRSPGEWYAELYAAYWIGKLPPAHPAYGLFDANED